MRRVRREDLEPFTEKLFSRSSGAGGQNVNKVETKVQLRFDISSSSLLKEHQARLLQKFPNGIIGVDSEETRSRARNMDIAFDRLVDLVNDSLEVKAPRKQTKPPHRTKLGKFKKMLKDKLNKYRRRNIDY